MHEPVPLGFHMTSGPSVQRSPRTSSGLGGKGEGRKGGREGRNPFYVHVRGYLGIFNRIHGRGGNKKVWFGMSA